MRLVYDKTRQAHVVLFPEGVLTLNTTAVAVLELCNGTLTAQEIVSTLAARYTGFREQDVVDVLNRLTDRKIVRWA